MVLTTGAEITGAEIVIGLSTGASARPLERAGALGAGITCAEILIGLSVTAWAGRSPRRARRHRRPGRERSTMDCAQALDDSKVSWGLLKCVGDLA
jgi:hypothetical protein